MAERRLCVAHLTLGLDMGGQEKVLVQFARHADRARFDLRFASFGSGGVLAPDIEACGWPVRHLGEPDGFRPGLVVRLARLFRRWGAAVVHTHEDRPLIHGAPAARLAGAAAVVHTRHGQSPRLTVRQRRLVSLAARLTDRFVCVSADAGRLTVGHGVPPGKVATIRNGIDLDGYPCRGPRPGGPAVCVARLSPEKGVDVLVRAAALAAAAEPSFRLEVAGDGAEMAELRQLIEALGVGGQVRLLGQVRDVAGLLGRAGLFVLPSRSEGVALTLLEAMASGLPVVATRVGGNVEVVADGETGWLVPPADPPALAAALLRLWRDPAAGRALGAAGRRRAERHFDVRRTVAAYEELYLAAAHRDARHPVRCAAIA